MLEKEKLDDNKLKKASGGMTADGGPFTTKICQYCGKECKETFDKDTVFQPYTCKECEEASDLGRNIRRIRHEQFHHDYNSERSV